MNKTIDFAGEPYRLEYQKVIYKGPYFHRDVLELLFVMRGELEIDIEGEKLILKRGEYVCINTGMVHSVNGIEDTYMVSLYLDLNYFEKKYPFIKTVNHFTKYTEDCTEDLDQYHAIRNYLIRLMTIESLQIPMRRKLSIELCDIILEILINYIYDDVYLKKRLCEMKPSDRERMMSISMFIFENYNKRGFSLAELAANEHLSATRLSHFWKEMTNTSFKDTINALRFMESKRLLMEGELPISKIVEECGYSDEKYLYKTIKDIYGMTPAEFRKNHKRILSIPGDYKVIDTVATKAEIIDYSSNFYSKVYDLSFLQGRFDQIEEENLNELYTIITTANKKLSCNEEITYDRTVLDLGLNSGLRLVDDKYEVNWEYVYSLGQITIKLMKNCLLSIDIELMSITEWIDIIESIRQKVYDKWGDEFRSKTALLVTYRGYENLAKARDFADDINKLDYFVKTTPVLFLN